MNNNCICIEFKTSGTEYFATTDELVWRHKLGLELDKLLKAQGLGEYDGGSSGGGTMEIFCYVTDIVQSVEVIKQYLTDQEWLQFCKIGSFPEDTQKWVVHYPEGATFSNWE